MMRRTFGLWSAAAASVAAAPAKPEDVRLHALHKLLIGETQFRNGVPLKVCNIEYKFGPSWKADIEAYAKKLPADQRTVLERQVARVQLTRYTTRELGLYCGEGPRHLDRVARDYNVAQGKAYLESHGAEKFEQYVKEEAASAKWSDADAKKFIDAVKAAK